MSFLCVLGNATDNASHNTEQNKGHVPRKTKMNSYIPSSFLIPIRCIKATESRYKINVSTAIHTICNFFDFLDMVDQIEIVTQPTENGKPLNGEKCTPTTNQLLPYSCSGNGYRSFECIHRWLILAQLIGDRCQQAMCRVNIYRASIVQ